LRIKGESGCGRIRFGKVDFVDRNARSMIAVKDSEWYIPDMNEDSCFLSAGIVMKKPDHKCL
jgi:hypothetical protein